MVDTTNRMSHLNNGSLLDQIQGQTNELSEIQSTPIEHLRLRYQDDGATAKTTT